MQLAALLSESTSSGTPDDSRSPLSVSSDQNGTSGRITRKSHRKSRAGCKNCKTRRIKCDETKPQCTNCRKRGHLCDFAKPLTTQGSQSENCRNATRSENLPMSEIELTYHWTTSTCHSISAWQTGGNQYQTDTAEIGFNHAHVMHLIFTLTALHLAFSRPDRREYYTATAEHHYDRGLALLTPEIANIDEINCDAVYMSAQLICFINWAHGPQPGEYLAFADNGRSDFLILFRGIRATLASCLRENFVKTYAPSIRSKHRPLPPLNEPSEYANQLREIHEHILFASEIPAVRDDNVKIMEDLQEMYHNRYQRIDSEYHVVFGWLFRASEAFLDRLQQRDPLALIMYAHFVVLMHDMEKFWYLKGWTHHVMQGIWNALLPENKKWVKWPIATVGWIAP